MYGIPNPNPNQTQTLRLISTCISADKPWFSKHTVFLVYLYF